MKSKRAGFLVVLAIVASSLSAQAGAGSRSEQPKTAARSAIREPSSDQRQKSVLLGNPEDPNFQWSSMLNFREHFPPATYHPIGVKLGSWQVLDEPPPVVYNSYLLPASIREDGWYLPTTLELFRLPKPF